MGGLTRLKTTCEYHSTYVYSNRGWFLELFFMRNEEVEGRGRVEGGCRGDGDQMK